MFKANEEGLDGFANLADRCLFHDVAVEQIIAVVEKAGHAITKEVKAWVYESLDMPMASKPVEDVFKDLEGMVAKQRNLRVAPKRAFAHIVRGPTIEMHKWKGVEHQQAFDHTRNASVDEKWFSPDMLKPSVKSMREIMGFNDKVKWYSPGACGISQQATDLDLMRYVLEDSGYAWVEVAETRSQASMWFARF